MAGTPSDSSPSTGAKGGTLLRSGQPRILCAWRATEPAYHKARTALFDAGYSVLEVWDLPMLQRVLQERNFDLLIFDIRLPDVSFPQVVGMTGHGGRTIPIVVVSDRSNAEWRWSTFDGGAYEYLVLPSEEQEFLDSVNDALATERFKTDFPVFAPSAPCSAKRYAEPESLQGRSSPLRSEDGEWNNRSAFAPRAESQWDPSVAGASTVPPSAGDVRSAHQTHAPAVPQQGSPPRPAPSTPPAEARTEKAPSSNVKPFPTANLPIPAESAVPLPFIQKDSADFLAMRKDISAVKERERQLRIELEAKERMIKKMERFESMVIELQSENAHLKEAVARSEQNVPSKASDEPSRGNERRSRMIPAALIVLLVLLAGGFYVWKNGLPHRAPDPTAVKPAAPSAATARIFHPTELTDVALTLAESLGQMGVQVQALEPLTNPVSRTAVFYAQGKEETAHAIAGRLGPDTDLRQRDWPSEADLIIVLGEDRLEEP